MHACLMPLNITPGLSIIYSSWLLDYHLKVFFLYIQEVYLERVSIDLPMNDICKYAVHK